jgi:hypothetical protein
VLIEGRFLKEIIFLALTQLKKFAEKSKTGKRKDTVKLLNNSVLLRFGAPCVFLPFPAWILCFPAVQDYKKVPQDG